MSDWTGKQLSKVIIERPLARGGMAEVYLGRHQTLDIPVAVKILHAHLSEDSQLQARFQAEARAVAALRHPNIVQVYDFDISEGRPYIVMELVEGPSLAQYLTSLHTLGIVLPLETVARLLRGLCDALDYAHGRGIVHRDVKPANVILRRSGSNVRPGMPLPPDVQPVLTDFGIARIAGGAGQTASGTILGTPAYMSPEQVRGERVDAASDIYALGVMLYEMLAGKLPFTSDEDTPVAMVYKHLNEPVPPIPNVSAAVQAVVDRAMAKPAGDRFPSAGAFEAAFIDALPGSEKATLVAARQSTPKVRSQPGPRRPTRGLLIGAGAVALVGVLVVGVIAGRSLLGAGSSPGATTELPPAVSPGATAAVSPATSIPQPTALPIPGEGSLAVIGDTDLSVRLFGLPPADPGTGYALWLTSPQAGPAFAAMLQFEGDVASLEYRRTESGSLLMEYSAGEVWLGPAEPGDLPEGSLTLFLTPQEDDAGLLTELIALGHGGTVAEAVLSGSPLQTGHYDSHLQFAVDALRGGDLPAAKRHAEHLINIVDGAAGESFGDWNDDGRAENPGDSFGLLPYLHLLDSLLLPAQQDPKLMEEQRLSAGEARAEAERLSEQVARALGIAQRIAASDTADEALPRGEQLSEMLVAGQAQALVESVAGLPLGLEAQILPAPVQDPG